MKTLGTISLAVFLFLVAASVGTYSQDRDDSRLNQTQEEKDKAKNNGNDKQEDKAAKQEQKREHDQPDVKQEERKDKDVARQQDKQEKRERSGQEMERDQHQHAAAANHGQRIPDDKFRAHFGRRHTFRVQRTQVVNVDQPVIVYGGYSFQLVEAWPAGWDFDDNCYIDYVDGEYFLFDVLHPSIRIAVFVVG